MDVNDNSKVNIELQIKMMKHWDKRSLFYLAKMFTDDLLMGEDYTRLKRCICISILDFNVDDEDEYHKVYRLRDGVQCKIREGVKHDTGKDEKSRYFGGNQRGESQDF